MITNVSNIKLYVVLTLVLILTLNLQAPDLSEDLKEKILKEKAVEVKKSDDYNRLYEVVVNSIKLREGFMESPYYCPGGILTIGYGHAIKKEEIFYEPITEYVADQILRKDLNIAITYVQQTTNLEHTQALAMAQFVYNVGIGNFYSSTLRQLILANEPIDEELLKWIHIKTKNGIIKSEWLLQSRKTELELFKLTT